ncbi:single-strand DNA-binding protein [Flavimobilis soli]|uniref:Single-strand DNA-binding protein n=1 Tax=Flavimobilis soli TaxID=442709 RepID=A0A2A9ECN4_9MICO|nr:single-stranded DNA-binding protein [Flavimobilis soli]PFG36045.1 single-strand DNA-binding protein [Flavimobilis soli]
MSSTITVRGWVGNKPTLTRTANDRVFTTVRVASTHRYRDSRNEWVDGDTQWFSAVFWDDAAENVARSVRQGEPVVLTGRLVLERWDSEEGPRSSLGVRGATLGHDLTRGIAQFTRCVRTAGAGFEPAPPGDRAADPFATPETPDVSEQDAPPADVDEAALDASAEVGEELGAYEPATA